VVADSQKRAFRKNPNNKGKFIDTGIWSWSRHPNYFGEMTLWFGRAVMALPVLSGLQWVTLISPIFVVFLLTKVSGIPTLAKKAKQRWGDDADYQAYVANTSLLIPLPPKK
jgi:steroid 5-alpha reductase family enzyme